MSEEEHREGVAVETAETSPVTRSLHVEVAAKRVRRAFDRAYRELAKKVRVRGFRPGKAPRSVLQRLYGASLAEDIQRTLVAETLPEAIRRAELSPVAEPSVEARPPEAEAPFRYTATLEVKPAIELPADLSGLPGKRPAVHVPEEDVERELEGLRERRAALVDEPDEVLAQSGHVVAIDYEGRIEGEPFEGGTAQGVNVELGSGRFLPGFEEQLEGAQKGESREVRITYPGGAANDALAGKEAVFSVRVVAVKRRQLPALDDAFARELGEFESLEQLEERIREDLRRQREQGARDELRRTLLDALLERTDFEVPPGLVERRLEQRLSLAHRQLGDALPEQELHSRIAQWREEWRPQAEREVRETLLLEAVAEREELVASSEEVEARVEEMAREQGVDPARLRRAYEERGMLEAVAGQLREEKAFEFLASEAKVEEVTGT